MFLHLPNDLLVGWFGQYRCKTDLCEKSLPEGEHFPHIHDLGNPDWLTFGYTIVGIGQQFVSQGKEVGNLRFLRSSHYIIFLASASVKERTLIFNGNLSDLAEIFTAFTFKGINGVQSPAEIEALEGAFFPGAPPS